MRGPWSRREILRAGLATGAVAMTSGLTTACAELGFGDTLERIRREGVVRLGHAGERPFAYEDDGLLGALPAVHRVVFERLVGEGVEVVGVRTLFRYLLEGLNSGRYDAVAAGMFIGGPRCDLALFSAPIYCARAALLVRKGNPVGLSDYASVAAREAKLAVLGGTAEQSYAAAAGVARERLRVVASQREGVEAVAENDADAFTLTSVSLRALVDSLRAQEPPPDRPDDPALDGGEPAELVEVLDPFVPAVEGQPQLGCGGAAFRKTDQALRDAFNSELTALRREGRILPLTEPYGFTRAEMPPSDVTTEQLCRTGTAGAYLDPLPR
ncbi:amino acid ABC transporter substrate-binding protein, PAAT family [Amycolatopsis marina]|uniref:Amino acid ABC transporter substrate-binding protein, PAAT family n=1 Tax=Amycolatopsis marina TaxID=490629 RepID=A0A1I0V9E3_9PSEU|nr:transporter substrate-binding domain-containing protein [Amycolatopsis marina]SFA72945.1 amino acid ABC transporter substrate-binding protein, PAAT family [Amycolatopsis marina]